MSERGLVVGWLAADAIRTHLDVAVPRELGVGVHGADDAERRALLAQGWAQARAAGLVDDRGRVEDFVESAFRLFDRPQRLGRLVVGDVTAGKDWSAVLAQRGEFAVLAYPVTDGVVLRRVPPDAAAAAMHDLLPTLPPGAGPRTANAPVDALAEAGRRSTGEPGSFASMLTDAGVASSEARLFGQVCTAPRLRIAQFTASGDYRHGRDHAAHAPTLDVLDTAAGRYLTEVRDGWVLLSPGHPNLVVDRIDDLLRRAVAATPTRA